MRRPVAGLCEPGRPAMGSWVYYGLGSDSEDLPGFVVLTSSGRFGQSQPIAPAVTGTPSSPASRWWFSTPSGS